MKIEPLTLIRPTVIACLILGLALLIPGPNIKATTCSGGTICIENGFLTVVDPNKTGQFVTDGLSIGADTAKIPQFSLLNYEEMKSLYFTQAKSISGVLTKNATVLPDNTELGTQNLTSTAQLYNVNGNLSAGGNPGGDQTAVYFVDGTLSIGNDITYGDATHGLVFVVNGEVHISQNVNRVDAFIITYNRFCDTWSISSTCDANINRQLTVNGSVIALNSVQPPKFYRTNGSNSTPAEHIIFQPKYLVILKDIFSKDLIIWREIQ